jgi:hypothetical protein
MSVLGWPRPLFWWQPGLKHIQIVRGNDLAVVAITDPGEQGFPAGNGAGVDYLTIRVRNQSSATFNRIGF